MSFLNVPNLEVLPQGQTSKFSKVLVSGINGPLGKAVIDLVRGEETFIGFTSKECNLLDIDSVRRFFESQIASLDPSKIAYVHLAARSGGIEFTRSSPATAFMENMEMGMNVAKVCQELGIMRLLFTLSITCYSDFLDNPSETQIHDGPVKSDDYGYAYAKRMQEVIMRAFNQQYGMAISSVLVNGIVGSKMSFAPDKSILPASLIREFHKQLNSREMIHVAHDPLTRREYTSARDLAEAIVWCLYMQEPSTLLNIGNTTPYSVKDVALLAAMELGIDIDRLVFDEQKSLGRLQQSSSNTQFLKLAGFRYRPLREAIRDAVSWYLSNEGKVT